MKRILRFILRLFLTLIAFVLVVIGLGVYMLYTPDPDISGLSGTMAKGNLDFGGVSRSYRTYLPKNLPPGAPLIFVMHGAGENGGEIRVETGYAFDRLADKHGLAVVYPDGYQGWWNACVSTDDSEANHGNVDDVGFLAALGDKLTAEVGIDPHRIFATGVSNGGDMAIRLILEAPRRYRAVAPVAANIPAPENYKCRAPDPGGTSVLLLHGTADKLVPFEGGEGSLFGFYPSGRVLSTLDTGTYFAGLAGLKGSPAIARGKTSDGFAFDQIDWPASASVEVELFAIQGAGHVFPQPYYRARRLLGASPKDPDGAELIWSFFSRQK